MMTLRSPAQPITEHMALRSVVLLGAPHGASASSRTFESSLPSDLARRTSIWVRGEIVWHRARRPTVQLRYNCFMKGTIGPRDWIRMYERSILRTEDALAGYDVPDAERNIAEI